MQGTCFRIVVKDYIIFMKEKVQFDNSSRYILEDLLDSDKILGFLGHFQLVDMQVTNVNKVLNPVRLVIVSF